MLNCITYLSARNNSLLEEWRDSRILWKWIGYFTEIWIIVFLRYISYLKNIQFVCAAVWNLSLIQQVHREEKFLWCPIFIFHCCSSVFTCTVQRKVGLTAQVIFQSSHHWWQFVLIVKRIFNDIDICPLRNRLRPPKNCTAQPTDGNNFQSPMIGLKCWLKVKCYIFVLLILTVYFFIYMDICEQCHQTN